MMKIKTARFVISAPSLDKCPPSDKPEYAFIGRSNVGKSSLINMLTAHKGLAMTSNTPGKTMTINYFDINDEWTLVDLPGYGYAQRSKTQREALRRMIDGYVLGRQQLVCLFVLVDSRHDPQKIDLEFMGWLAEHQVPFAMVFTKLDKMGPEAGRKQTASYLEKMLEQWEELPRVFTTSAADGRGRQELLDYIEQLNKQMLNA